MKIVISTEKNLILYYQGHLLMILDLINVKAKIAKMIMSFFAKNAKKIYAKSVLISVKIKLII